MATLGIVTLAVSLAACGSGSSSTASRTTPGASTTATTATPTTPTKTTKTTKTTTSKTPHTTHGKTAPATHPTSTTQTTTAAPANSTTTTTTHTTPATIKTTTTTTTSSTPTNAAPVYTRPIHATLVGENHAPIVNKNWTYSVTVTDARGLKLSGTATTNYLFNGAVVGTEKPENVPFRNGFYRDTIQFPAASVGIALAIQTVVHTSIGSIAAEWAIKVQQ